MFANIFAQHTPYQQSWRADVAGPAQAPTPMPKPPSDPIAFAAVARASLYGIVGSAIGSTTMATITCADDAMTIALSHEVPGLTFSYASKVLSVAGTPTGPTSLTRVVVTYIASDGSAEVRGSTAHEVTIMDASEVLTIGSMAGASGRVGRPLSATLASPSTNFEVDVRIAPTSLVPGLTPALTWTVGSGSASGTLDLAGTPTLAGTYSLDVDFYGFGQLLGSSAHAIVIGPSYETTPPAPSPAPAPTPPSPSPPPAPTPAPSPGYGADPTFDRTRVLMHFNSATGIATDVIGNAFTATGATLTTGAVAEGALFDAGADTISAQVPGLIIEEAADEHLTVECMVKVNGSGLWTAVYADGVRYMPVVSFVEPDGALIWSLGFVSLIDSSVPESPSRQVHACFIVATEGSSLEVRGVTVRNYLKMALGRSIAPLAQFRHVIGMLEQGSPSTVALWLNGKNALAGTCETFTGTLRRPTASAEIRIGSRGVPNPCAAGRTLVGLNNEIVVVSRMLMAEMTIDELRIKQAAHYGDYITGTNTQADIPAASRVIPWPNS